MPWQWHCRSAADQPPGAPRPFDSAVELDFQAGVLTLICKLLHQVTESQASY